MTRRDFLEHLWGPSLQPKDSADLREIAKALRLLEESRERLDNETRQKLFEALINRVENGIV